MSKFQCFRTLVAEPNRLGNRLFLANVTTPSRVFVQVTLHVETAYSAWTISVNDGIAKIFQLSRNELRGTRKIYHPDL
jgi:hypothetical protein